VVEAEELDERGMVIDFLVLQAALRQVLDRYEHQDLNRIPPFDAEVNPSAENVARLIAEQLLQLLAGKVARLVEVQLAETDAMSVTCRIIADEAGT
jgi:6-pyruvoyltetrahydropterin/6-carboxytetrahydropterin synthase